MCCADQWPVLADEQRRTPQRWPIWAAISGRIRAVHRTRRRARRPSPGGRPFHRFEGAEPTTTLLGDLLLPCLGRPLDGWLAVGDLLLVAVAERLAGQLDPGDLIARIGGDEFVVLVAPSTGRERLVELTDRLLAALVAPIPVEGHHLSLSISIGVVEAPASGGTARLRELGCDTAQGWYYARPTEPHRLSA
jgi:hypothetical protein